VSGASQSFTDVAATGNLTVDGNTVLGNASTDTLNVGNGGLVKDASGNVGIGTTSPGRRLNVAVAYSSGTIVPALKIATVGGYDSNSGTGIDFGQDQGTYSTWVTGRIASPRTNSNWGGSLTFLTNNDSSETALIERARIDSSGNLLVGTTDANINSGAGLKFLPSTTASMGIVGASSTNSNTSYHLYSTGAANYRFYVGYGGTVYATSTTITGISDVRLKENIRDLDDGLDVVMALKPRKFDWKEGKGADTKNARGFIAQEFEQVLPDMIEEWKDPAPEGEEPYKAVNANLIPTLVKAIQEQQAIIQTLTDRITALENK
jgi:hypothetical protein